MKILILGLVLMLLVAGCTQGQTEQKKEKVIKEDKTVTDDKTVKKEDKLAPKPSFSIDAPAADSAVAPGNVVVSLGLKNFALGVPETANKPNEGHFHLFLDNGTYQPCAERSCTINGVSEGEHVIKVVMQQNDHSEYAGVKSNTVKFVVKGTPGYEIASPASGSTAARGKLQVKLSLKSFALGVPETANKEGTGHFHLYLDGGNYIPCASDTCDVGTVGPGSHTVKVDMRNNDHSLYEDGNVKTVTFTVR